MSPGLFSEAGAGLGVDEVRDVRGLLRLVGVLGALEDLEVVRADVVPNAALGEHPVHRLLHDALGEARAGLRARALSTGNS